MCRMLQPGGFGQECDSLLHGYGTFSSLFLFLATLVYTTLHRISQSTRVCEECTTTTSETNQQAEYDPSDYTLIGVAKAESSRECQTLLRLRRANAVGVF